MKLKYVIIMFFLACCFAAYTSMTRGSSLTVVVPIIMGISVVFAGLYLRSLQIKRKYERRPQRRPRTYSAPPRHVRPESLPYEEGGRRVAQRDYFMREVENALAQKDS